MEHLDYPRERERRALRVGTYRSRGKQYPELRLRGAWLEEAGYRIGQEVEIREVSDTLVIFPSDGVCEGELALESGQVGSRANCIAPVPEFEDYRVTVRLERGRANGVLSLRSPADVARVCKSLKYRDREVFHALYLDTKNHLVGADEVAVGTVNASLVHPREIYKAAILTNASSLVVVHNHPSGDPGPSPEDVEITTKIGEAGKLLGIELLDHVIIGEAGYFSLRESGLLKS